MSEKILIIEDDSQIARFIELELKHEGFEVDKIDNGYDGLNKIKENDYDLLLLDLMLPGIDGIELCDKIRDFSDIPIIMLTAKSELEDKVKGLDIGADDYLTKPFEIEELLARIRVCLKRLKKKEVKKNNCLNFNQLEINTDMMTVSYGDEAIDLTKKEYELLKFLVENKRIVLSRDLILNKVWGYDYYGDTNIVDVYIRYLRSKIDEPFNQKIIHTVRGVGYILKDE